MKDKFRRVFVETGMDSVVEPQNLFIGNPPSVVILMVRKKEILKNYNELMTKLYQYLVFKKW